MLGISGETNGARSPGWALNHLPVRFGFLVNVERSSPGMGACFFQGNKKALIVLMRASISLLNSKKRSSFLDPRLHFVTK